MGPSSRAFAALATAALLVSFAPGRATACSCTNIPDFARAFAESDVILLGEVTGIRPAQPGAVWATLRIVGWWKGAPPNTMIDVLTGENDGNCGVHFTVGTQYIVYAFHAPSMYGGTAADIWTHSCWRTHETYPEDPDLAALGPVPVSPASWGALKISYR